jgi:hypothetical protein
MLRNFSYYPIFGLPLVLYIGIIALLFILTAGVLGYLIFKGHTNIPIKLHKLMAAIGISIALIHGTLAILAYL